MHTISITVSLFFRPIMVYLHVLSCQCRLSVFSFLLSNCCFVLVVDVIFNCTFVLCCIILFTLFSSSYTRWCRRSRIYFCVESFVVVTLSLALFFFLSSFSLPPFPIFSVLFSSTFSRETDKMLFSILHFAADSMKLLEFCFIFTNILYIYIYFYLIGS